MDDAKIGSVCNPWKDGVVTGWEWVRWTISPVGFIPSYDVTVELMVGIHGECVGESVELVCQKRSVMMGLFGGYVPMRQWYLLQGITTIDETPTIEWNIARNNQPCIILFCKDSVWNQNWRLSYWREDMYTLLTLRYSNTEWWRVGDCLWRGVSFNREGFIEGGVSILIIEEIISTPLKP